MNSNVMQWLLWLKGALLITIKYLLIPLSIILSILSVSVALAFWGCYFFTQAIGDAIQIIIDFGWDNIPVAKLKFNTAFKSIRHFKPRIGGIRWMTSGEISRVISRLVRILGLSPGAWIVLAARITRLYRLGGPKFTVAYLKECRLALLCWVNTSPYSPNPGVKIRLTPAGLPRIIPAGIRPVSIDTAASLILIRGLHTVFNLYKVMDWKGAKADFSSITNPFSGVMPILPSGEIAAVLRLFTLPNFRLGYSTPWVSISSGPNHPWSLWGSAKDVFGYALNPIILMVYCGYTWVSGQRLLALWLVVLSHLVLPFALFLRFRNTRFPLGRLSVLAKDGGGKRRIVGVVDYWSQWALKSLHLYLFDVLRLIPQDGTFDQMAPVKALLDFSRLGYPSFSFDLSNATDRLPVALQEQILHLLSGSRLLAWMWRLIMTFRSYTNPDCGRIKYAVGQPMGALSSWAMLAVTHHVIVQLAAFRSGWKGWFPLYALLGDDIVILTKEVADQYLSIMRFLGVPINTGKSIISDKGLLEFAKRVVSPHFGDISGVSTRELLRFTRTPGHAINLFSHLMDLGLIVFPSQGLEMVKRVGVDLKRFPPSLLLASAYMRSRVSGVCRLPSAFWADEWFRLLHGPEVAPSTVATVDVGWMTEASLQACVSFRGRALMQWKAFQLSWFRYPLFKGTLAGIFSIPLLMISPGPWAQFYALCVALVEVSRDYSALRLESLISKEWGNTRIIGRDPIPVPFEFSPPALPQLEFDLDPSVNTRAAIEALGKYQLKVLALQREVTFNEKYWALGTSRVSIRSGLALPAPKRISNPSEMKGWVHDSAYF